METEVRDGVLQCRTGRDTRWLSSGWRGGFREASAVYNVTVPEGWPEVDLDAYADERRERSGFEESGPTLFTGVGMQHARGARLAPVTAVATAGLSNPAWLPMNEDAERGETGSTNEANEANEANETNEASPVDGRVDGPPGTVNVVLFSAEALTDGALASLAGVAVEAKTATLLDAAGVPGTTTDAVVAGCPLPAGEERECETVGDGAQDSGPRAFAGSATAVGRAARVCVREAVGASLASRYADESLSEAVAGARYGVVSREQADVFTPS